MAIDYSNPAYGNWLNGTPNQGSGGASGSPIQLKTTRDTVGNLTTSTPGYVGQAPAGQGFGDVVSKILSNRQAARPQAAVQPTAMQPMASAAIPQYAQAPQQYAPQLGAAPAKQKEITRTVADPRVSPYHKIGTGLAPNDVVERYIPGVGWEFDSIRPHGSSGGIQGGGAASSLHPSDLSGERAYNTGSPAQGKAGGGAAPGATTTDTGLTKESQAAAKANRDKKFASGERIPARTWDFS